MSELNHIGRVATTASYDYPPASQVQEYDSDDVSSDSTTESQLFERTRPLTTEERPYLEPHILSYTNRLRAERAQRSRRSTTSRTTRRPTESHIRDTTPPSFTWLRNTNGTARSRSRMRRVLQTIRENDSAFQEADPYPPDTPPPPYRRYATPSNYWRSRRQPSQRPHRMNDSSLSELHEAGERLAQRNEDINASIAAMSNIDPPRRSRRPRSMSEDPPVDECRSKRRRLNDTVKRTAPARQYGREGQIVSGKLQMDIVSSDGGSLQSSFPGTREDYHATNILVDDSTVYCSKGSACNIVLRHEGDTAFDLERLVIKAPKMGFTDPVQEGLVFASMEHDEKFEQTAKYKILHFPSSYFGNFYPEAKPIRTDRHHRRTSALDSAWPALEPTRAGLVPRATAVAPQGQGRADSDACLDEPARRHPTREGGRPRRSIHPVDRETGEIGISEMEDSSDSPSSSSVLTDSEDEEENNPRREREDTPISFRDFLQEEQQRTEDLSISRAQPANLFRTDEQRARMDRARQAREERSITLAQEERARMRREIDRASAAQHTNHASNGDPPRADLETNPNSHRGVEILSADRDRVNAAIQRRSAAARSVQDQVAEGRPPTDETVPTDTDPTTKPYNPNFSLLAPAARFSMRHQARRNRDPSNDANTMTIKFDPPISGRYLLLKVWNPQKDRKIDIQSVSVHGFAGPRWFPAFEQV